MEAASAWLLAQDPWEALAVVLALAYLLLAVRENLWCWAAAFASTLIYLLLFWQQRLYMQSALQLWYLVMAVYGWWSWRGGAHEAQALPISRRPLRWHLGWLALLVVASVLNGALLLRYTDAALPWGDALATWGSVFATWMVARKILENWLWWFLIDALSLYLYLDRGLYLTGGLFLGYLVIVVFGYRSWQRHYREQQATRPAALTG
ncbi:MAG: nicotinamide riboside transporter PnuC [Gammaproteobacteria bacterium]